MKYIVLFFCILLTLVSAGEVERIDSILKDITKLRSDYNSVSAELKIYKKKFNEQKSINSKSKECIKHIEIKTIIKNTDTNSFPKLKMKHEQKHFKALSFRLKRDASIYNGVDGEKLFEWERGTSFTSHTKADNWIKITGYFVNKLWKSAQKELWVRENDAHSRK